MKNYIKTEALLLFLIALFLIGNVFAQPVNPFLKSYNGFNTGTPSNGLSPVAAFLYDLDADNDEDIVIARGNFSSGFSVMMNSGGGTFTDPQHYPTGNFASADIVIADFTGDALPDVAVTNPGTSFGNNKISVFPGTGNGNFGAKTDYTVADAPLGITSGDYNSDGFTDIATANNGGFGTGSTVSILYNNGSGGFTNIVTHTIPGGYVPYKLATADMNNDSLADIVVANEGSVVTILKNSAQGFTFSNLIIQTTSMTDYYFNLKLADADNDNDIDIFYSSKVTYEIAYRENQGNWNFDSTQMILLNGYGGATSIDINDMNGDNLPDIIATSATGRASDGFRIAFNQGNGTYSSAILRSAGQYTLVVLTSDTDLDGDNDVLTVDNYTMALTVHLNDGSGTFPLSPYYDAGVPTISTKLEAGDIDNDGDLDIATSADSRTAVNVPVSVSLNNGNGTFAPAIIYSTIGGGLGVKFRDLNNDGSLDLLYASGINTPPYDFFTAINLGNGTFATPTRWPMNSCGWNDIDGADIDNDGDIDAIVTEWLGCPSIPFSNQRVFISYNLGGGIFSAPVIKIVDPFAGPIAICDFNEDGYLDLATGHASWIDISLNTGTGDFNAPTSFPMSQSPYDILATDLNNDGHSDIASCNYGSNRDYNLTVRLGNGDGTFQAVQLLPAVYCPDLANVSGLAAGDIDNDGDLDILVAGNASNDICLYINDGAGIFTFMMRAGVDHGVRSPWFADFNNDGKGDVAVLTDHGMSGLNSAISLLEGATTGLNAGGAGLSACNTTVTAITTTSDESGNSLYPNPFNAFAYLKLNFSSRANCIINIYNTTGQKVRSTDKGFVSEGENILTLNREGLAQGYYHIEVIAGKDVFNLNAAVE